MVCLLHWAVRKAHRIQGSISSDILHRRGYPVSWVLRKELRVLARNRSGSLLWNGDSVRGAGRVVGQSDAYCLNTKSMAIENGQGTNQSVVFSAAEDPVEVVLPARKLLTLVIIHREGKVLLGMKKRGFGKGYYNGFGGKVEKGETIEEAAARELQEESGVTATDMEKRGILTFHFDNDPVVWEVHVYYVTKFVGDPCETEEMAPAWFPVADIPYATMWSDDPIWYPLLLAGQQFKGDFFFTNTTTLTSHTIGVVQRL